MRVASLPAFVGQIAVDGDVAGGPRDREVIAR